MKRAVIFLAVVATAAAESNFTAPLVGVARDQQQQLLLVYGIAGNFVVKGAAARGVLNVAFSGYGGLAKTTTQLLMLNANGAVVRSAPAPRGNALLAPPSSRSRGLYFFTETAELWQSAARADRKVPLESLMLAGRVIALEALDGDGRYAQLAVCRATALWLIRIELNTGQVVGERMAVGAIGENGCQSGSLLLLNRNLLLATRQELILQDANGEERRLQYPSRPSGVVAIRQIGETWIEVETPGEAPLLVRLTGDGEKIYRLPAAEVGR
jgi:hypothetical protein